MARINIAPDIDLLESIAMRSASLREALQELADNSFDWGATKLEIQAANGRLIVEDNGAGISKWRALLKLGHRHPIKLDRMGRYGVGFKYAALWLAEAVDIETRHDNARAFTRIDWKDIAEDWGVETGEFQPDPGPSFTRLEFHRVRGRRLQKLSAVAKDLAYRYTPALRKGAQVIINGQHLEPVEFPSFAKNPTVLEGLFNDVQHWRLTAGVKADHAEPKRSGYDIVYKNRIIRQHDVTGFETYSAQQFYGYLELLDDGEEDWTLADNKEDFAEHDDLLDRLLPLVEPLLIEAAKAHDQMGFRDLGRDVTERFNRFRTGIREVRKPGKEKGTHTATGKGRPRNPKNVVSDPNKKLEAKLRGRSIHITFDYHVPDRIGEVQDGRTAIVVSLNPDHPSIKSKDPVLVTHVVCALLMLDDSWGYTYRQLFLSGVELDEMKPNVADFSELLRRALPLTKGEGGNAEEAAEEVASGGK